MQYAHIVDKGYEYMYSSEHKGNHNLRYLYNGDKYSKIKLLTLLINMWHRYRPITSKYIL